MRLHRDDVDEILADHPLIVEKMAHHTVERIQRTETAIPLDGNHDSIRIRSRSALNLVPTVREEGVLPGALQVRDVDVVQEHDGGGGGGSAIETGGGDEAVELKKKAAIAQTVISTWKQRLDAKRSNARGGSTIEVKEAIDALKHHITSNMNGLFAQMEGRLAAIEAKSTGRGARGGED
jgi:hypothetical protein